MSKWLAVVALVLLVLSGAMGLRNLVVANAPTVSALNSSSLAIWANGPGPIPPIPRPPGGGLLCGMPPQTESSLPAFHDCPLPLRFDCHWNRPLRHHICCGVHVKRLPLLLLLF